MTSGNPIEGGGIMLCRMSGDQCRVESGLITETEAEGAFAFENLDPGQYAILYNPDGPAPQSAGLTLDFGDQGKLFGEKPVTVLRGSSLGVTEEGLRLREGSMYSNEHRVYLNWADFQAVSVVIATGEVVETVVRAWDK